MITNYQLKIKGKEQKKNFCVKNPANQLRIAVLKEMKKD